MTSPPIERAPAEPDPRRSAMRLRTAWVPYSQLATLTYHASASYEPMECIVRPTLSSSSRNESVALANARHGLRILPGYERLVRFTIHVSHVKDFEVFKTYVEKSLNPRLFNVGQQHFYVHSLVYPLNGRQTRAAIEVVVKTRRSFALDTAHDVYLHYLWWLRRLRYSVRDTMAECTRSVLTHTMREADVVGDDTPSATIPFPRRIRSLMINHAHPKRINNSNNSDSDTDEDEDGGAPVDKENARVNGNRLRTRSLNDANRMWAAERVCDESPGVSRVNSDAYSPPASPLIEHRLNSGREKATPASPRVKRLYRRHTASLGIGGADEFLNLLI
jgi:hypothetical protein